MYTSEYLLMHEIAWPRQMLLEIAQEFAPKILKRQSALRKFKYIKNQGSVLYEKFEKYHDNEISKKSWSQLFTRGFKMKIARQNGKGYFYAGPDSVRIINTLLNKVPEDGGFHFNGKDGVTVVNSLEVPEIKMPDIKIKTKTEPNLNENKQEETIKGPGRIIH